MVLWFLWPWCQSINYCCDVPQLIMNFSIFPVCSILVCLCCPFFWALVEPYLFCANVLNLCKWYTNVILYVYIILLYIDTSNCQHTHTHIYTIHMHICIYTHTHQRNETDTPLSFGVALAATCFRNSCFDIRQHLNRVPRILINFSPKYGNFGVTTISTPKFETNMIKLYQAPIGPTKSLRFRTATAFTW